MRKFTIFLIVTSLMSTFSCSTDFKINAEWEDIAVVYGLLDQSDTVQYIKLNKVFLGDADAYVMAQEPDSNFYNSAEVYLEPLQNGNNIYDGFGNKTRIQLIETDDIIKDEGVFSIEKNTLYKTTETLSEIYEYKLVIDIPGKEEITSTTSLVKDLKIVKPTTNPAEKVGLYNGQAEEYLDYKVEFSPTETGTLYGLTIRFHYREHRNDSVHDLFIDWVQSNKKRPATIDAGTTMNMTMAGGAFYEFIKNNITQVDDATKREVLGLDFIFIVAGEELTLFMEVNGPSQGIVQEKPAFTNITNGIGIFSSRYSKRIENKQLSNLAIDHLSCGEITRHLRFADHYGNYDCLNN